MSKPQTKWMKRPPAKDFSSSSRNILESTRRAGELLSIPRLVYGSHLLNLIAPHTLDFPAHGFGAGGAEMYTHLVGRFLDFLGKHGRILPRDRRDGGALAVVKAVKAGWDAAFQNAAIHLKRVLKPWGGLVARQQ